MLGRTTGRQRPEIGTRLSAISAAGLVRDPILLQDLAVIFHYGYRNEPTDQRSECQLRTSPDPSP